MNSDIHESMHKYNIHINVKRKNVPSIRFNTSKLLGNANHILHNNNLNLIISLSLCHFETLHNPDSHKFSVTLISSFSILFLTPINYIFYESKYVFHLSIRIHTSLYN